MIIIRYKILKPTLQMQITDYINGIKKEVYEMWVPKIYQRARKRFSSWMKFRPWGKKVKIPNYSGNRRLDEFLPTIKVPKLPNINYLLRFREVPPTSYEDFAHNVIPKIEWDMLQYLPKFKGFFNHIFEVNDLTYFDDIQEELEKDGANFKDIFLYDVIIYELMRRQVGFRDYTGLEKARSLFIFNPFFPFLHNPTFFPIAKEVSMVIKQVPSRFLMEYFLLLVKEAIELRLIYPRILLADGQFIRSNSNNNKKEDTDKYSDLDAGYCRHNGVKKGVGYDPWCLYAYMGPGRVIPVYFKMYPGNRNDNPVFRETLDEFLNLGIGEWIVIICDSGAYSKKTLEFCEKRGVYPIIRAKKNLKTQPTRELKKGYFFNTDYIPDGWSDEDFLRLYQARPMVEKALAPNNTFYNASRMNTRGMESAIKHRVLYYILDLLRNLTAVKLNRSDLVGKLRAFSQARSPKISERRVNVGLDADYDMYYPGFQQNMFMDN